MDTGEVGKGLDCQGLDGEAVADFGERLRGAGVIIRLRLIQIARIGDGAVGVDLTEGIACAKAKIPGAGAGAGIERQQQAVYIGRAGQIVDIGTGLGIADGRAD